MNNLITNLHTCIPSALSMLGGSFNLLYYSHIPTIIIALFFGLFVLVKSEKKLLSKVFFLLSIAFVFWSILDLFTWLSFDTRIIMFTWSVTGIMEALFFALSFYFVYVFIEKEDISLKYKILGGIILLPLIVMIPMKFNLSGFNADDCYALESNQSLYYKYFIEIILSIIIIIFSLIKIKKADQYSRKQIVILFVGIMLFLFSFFSAIFLSGYLVDNGWGVKGYAFEIYGLFGTTILMGFLGYLIVKFKAFNIKMLAAEALVVALVALIASEFFFVGIENVTVTILISVTVLLAAIFGIWLINSVKKEEQRKEELQLMSGKLSEANDQLRRLDNSKSEFISIASHQLRTPLTAIKGFVSLLLEGSYGKVDPKQGEVLNKVYSSNERMVNLVEDLLNVSRMESGRMEFKFTPCKVDDICQEVVDAFFPKAKNLGLYLDYKKPETELPEVMIDGTKVREVISNLVDNALKYTPKGGVSLRAELAESTNYKAQNTNKTQDTNNQNPNFDNQDVIRVTVSDTGIGVPATELPYLFAKFSRGKDISRLNATGTGLGLFVGKSMIEQNGGKIWAESDGENKGSKFIIEIPIQQSKELMDRWG